MQAIDLDQTQSTARRGGQHARGRIPPFGGVGLGIERLGTQIVVVAQGGNADARHGGRFQDRRAGCDFQGLVVEFQRDGVGHVFYSAAVMAGTGGRSWRKCSRIDKNAFTLD